MPSKKKIKSTNKNRVQNIGKSRLPTGKKLVLNRAVKVVPLNDLDNFEAGDVVTIVYKEDENGQPLEFESRQLSESDFEDEV